MKFQLTLVAAFAGLSLAAAQQWTVTVDDAQAVRPIKMMNAVNNGPIKALSDQSRGNFDEFAALKIPYARIHDGGHYYHYGLDHAVDITGIFPDFDADVNDPASYDFELTDRYLKVIREAGSEPYFRLGQSIEHWYKKYGVRPPKDFKKWAQICEHIVRHYNEGWAKGFKWNIRYWEIWNEPDGNQRTPDGREGPTWTGTDDQFLELYKVTSRHLRACFGDKIKIGGPAFCWWGAWSNKFLPFCAKEKLPLDFYSWHCYATQATQVSDAARAARDLLDKNGFTKTESHLNEWNYVRGWTDDWIYTLEAEGGRYRHKGAAFIASVLINCQDAPIDMLMFYDARLGCPMNNLFDVTSYRPIKGYYALYAWMRLRDLGQQVKTTVTGDRQVVACAAKAAKGRKGAVLISRYSNDDNLVAAGYVNVVLPKGVKASDVRCHVTDLDFTYTETPLLVRPDGTACLKMMPNSFALLEW